MEIGTARADPGEIARGYLEVAELPTAISEQVPVVIARGEHDGPTLWVTATQHSGEVTGLAVTLDVVSEDLASDLRGTVVCLPALNPSGLRRTNLTEEGRHSYRTSYYDNDNPNGYFPSASEREADEDGENGGDDGEGTSTDKPGISSRPRVQELICRRIFEYIEDSADALIDIHTAQAGWMPFSILGRVPYGTHRSEEDARDLLDEQRRLVDAFGVPVTRGIGLEALGPEGNRSISGASRDVLEIPAFVAELGGHSFVEEEYRKAGVVGLRNVMREMGMLPGDLEPNDAAPDSPVDFEVQHTPNPHTDTPGIARYHVDAGDVVQEGDPVCDIVSPNGGFRTTIESAHDGYIIGRYEGVARYRNDALCCTAIRDESDLVGRVD